MMKKNRIQNVVQQNFVTAEQSTTPINNSELRNKSEAVEQSPRKGRGKRVTFNLNVTTYEYVPIHEDFADDFVTSSAGSYPPNHSYRDSDDEAEDGYGDNDLGDLDDEDDYSDDGEDVNTRFLVHQVWTESILDASIDSKTGNSSPPAPMVKTQLPDEEVKEFGWRTNARDRGNRVNSVRNPVANISQWKAAKSKKAAPLKQQTNNSANFKAPHLLFSTESMFGQTPSRSKTKSNQEIAVPSNKSKSSFSGFNMITKSGQSTTSEGCYSPMSFKDFGRRTNARSRSDNVNSVRNPIENIGQWKAAKSKGTSLLKPQKNSANFVSPSMAFVSKKPYDMAQEKKVNWHSTPFETRLDRALSRVAAA